MTRFGWSNDTFWLSITFQMTRFGWLFGKLLTWCYLNVLLYIFVKKFSYVKLIEGYSTEYYHICKV